MRKKLTAALIIVVILLACAIGAIVYLETRSGGTPDPGVETTTPEKIPNDPTGTTAEQVTTGPAEETIAISLPTEDPGEVLPEETFGQENEVPAVTADPDATVGTEDRDSNELPEDEF